MVPWNRGVRVLSFTACGKFSRAVFLLVLILVLISVLLPFPIYAERDGSATANRYVILSINCINGNTTISELVRDTVSFSANHTFAGVAGLLINDRRVSAWGEIRVNYTGENPHILSRMSVDIRYTTARINESATLYHFVLRQAVQWNTSSSSTAESYVVYTRGSVPMISYNITSTNTTTAYFLDAMIRKLLFFPLLVTNVTENKREIDGNTTLYGGGIAASVSLIIDGEAHILAGMLRTGNHVLFTPLYMRLIYNMTAYYWEPIHDILRKILCGEINNYVGETGAFLVLGTYFQGVSTVYAKASPHFINTIMALSLAMNWSSTRLFFKAINNSFTADMIVSGKTPPNSLPEVFLVTSLALRGYRASSLRELLSGLDTIFNKTRVDPEAVLSSLAGVLEVPVYSLGPEVYGGASRSILRTNTWINRSVVEIIDELEAIHYIETNITITNTVTTHEIIIEPFPTLREDIAVYMALKNIQPTTKTTNTTTMTTLTTTPIKTSTTTQQASSPIKTETTSAPTQTTPAVPLARTQKQVQTQQIPTTTTSGAGASPSPLIILVPVIALALTILILHYRAKKRTTQELIEELSEGQAPEK